MSIELMAVDAGLRAGFAFYGADGRLRRYRSQNFGSMARLKKGAYALFSDEGAVRVLVVEGGGPAAEPWLKEAVRRDVRSIQVQAGTWRERLLLSRNRRSGSDAKARADVLARRVIEWSEAPRPTSLRHDAAEAILVGLWGVVEVGWLDSVPDAVVGP